MNITLINNLKNNFYIKYNLKNDFYIKYNSKLKYTKANSVNYSISNTVLLFSSSTNLFNVIFRTHLCFETRIWIES